MAKIRYLINGDPNYSMRQAIKSENIMYGRFYNKFKELWGRLSVRYFGDDWNKDMAKRFVDGVAVIGSDRVYLFKDASVGYKYTKEFCEIVGANYSSLLSDLGDVEEFYIDLEGVGKNLDFTSALLVENSMDNIVSILNKYHIDIVKVSFVVDSEVDPGADENMTLGELRNLSLPVDNNTADYLDHIPGIAPLVKFFTLPTSVYDEASDSYLRVDGEEITLDEGDISLLFGTFSKYTSYLDPCFSSVGVDSQTLESRVVGGDLSQSTTYTRYEYSINFDFESGVSTVDGEITSLIDWSYLGSEEFATNFSTEYKEHRDFYEANRDDEGMGILQYGLSDRPSDKLLVFSSIISFLDNYDDREKIFYNKRSGGTFYVSYETYLLFERAPGIRNQDLADILMLSLSFGYESKDTGWFGGSFLGKVLEVVFIFVVLVVAIILSIFFWNPYPLFIGMAILYGGARYTGMSVASQKMASFAIQVLSIAAIAFGLYNIYTAAYDLAVEEAIAEGMAEGASESAATEVAIAETGFTEVASQLGVSGSLEMANSVYSAFNLLSPVSSDNSGQDESVEYDEESDDSEIYNVKIAYDFYDDIYDIYD